MNEQLSLAGKLLKMFEGTNFNERLKHKFRRAASINAQVDKENAQARQAIARGEPVNVNMALMGRQKLANGAAATARERSDARYQQNRRMSDPNAKIYTNVDYFAPSKKNLKNPPTRSLARVPYNAYAMHKSIRQVNQNRH